jgi:hypothetical protein
MTDTDTRDRLARISALWERRPDWSEAQVRAQVDDELAAEAAQQAELDRFSAEMGASLDAMLSCPACGQPAASGLCGDCSRVAQLIALERAAAKPANGQDRRQLVEQWMDRRAVTP